MRAPAKTSAEGSSGRPKVVLFDWDNTLVESWPTIEHALNATFAAFGLPQWTHEEVRGRVRRSLRESFPPLFGARWEEAAVHYYEIFHAIHLKKLTPLMGARQMLDELAADGFTLGVVSNKKGDVLRRESAHLGWDGYFLRIVGAQDAPRDKPCIDVVDLALTGSGVARGPDVWFVGDTEIDLECAANAGCIGVLLRPSEPGPAEFQSYPPARHFADCQELSKALRRL
ncbi:MAG: HAD family hydrolase [Rhodospirillales bacterium]|nr:HAD family hydrolase [Rhodospirillales bacterium]